ncbi:MAG: phenylalanine--tRNA ligase subunit beta [Rhodobacteraceae bacterium]|nr:phenylalanine--tRNA ligase subunit beta [Paracoccaceae bacterium]
MKFTLSWLAEHIDTQASVHEIAEALTDVGLEVEALEDPASELGAFTICRVIKAEPHPDADRLRVCLVETRPDGPRGDRTEVQVVCGAPNARTGLIGVFAPPGTRIPGTGLELKKSLIRGVESAGMLCSEKEMKLSDEHDGIIELPPDSPLGAQFMEFAGLNDPVIEIAVTPNRPDALGVSGIARDLAARGLGVLKTSPVEPVPGRFPCPVTVTIDDDAKPEACPVFFGRVIRGVNNCESPAWLRRRLEAIGLRPISALVDITNFVTYDRNRPLHAFDADKVSGGLRIHPARGGESLTALDGAEHSFRKGQTLISDGNGPESIAGIMGGLATGCTEATVNVFLESALWNPVTTAATGRQLKISSDARYRFERGVDPEFALPGLEMATRLVMEICGGEASEVVFDGEVPDTTRSLQLRLGRVQQIAGVSVAPKEQLRILSDLGFAVAGEGDTVSVVPPSWRPDIFGEVDLVEEIARIVSLTKLEARPLPRPAKGIARQILTPAQKREQICRRSIAALGYNECVTYSFVDAGMAAMFSDKGALTELDNPMSSEMTVMRPDLLPGLLKAALANQSRGFGDLALFEVGPVFFGPGAGDEAVCAAGLLIGQRSPRGPHIGDRRVDLFDARADAETVLASMIKPTGYRVSREVASWWHPGRAGTMFLQPGKPLAAFGELNPKLLNRLGIKGVASAFTLFLDELPEARSKSRTRPAFKPETLQHVDRDFAFVVDNGVEAQALVAAVHKSKHRNMFGLVKLFDEYSGAKAEEQLGAGKKSLAVTVRLHPRISAFKESELEAISAEIAQRVEQATGGQLRS